MTREKALQLRAIVQKAITSLSDEDAAYAVPLYPEWNDWITKYEVGDRVRYQGVLYKVLQAHTSQPDWSPTAAPSLFAKILIPDPTTIVEWEQPDSTNGYMVGDRVLHNGITWVSTVNNNVWEPGAVGSPWNQVEDEQEQEDTVRDWEQPDSTNPYMTGDRVRFEGQIYESVIDNNIWSPAAYPAGWTLITE